LARKIVATDYVNLQLIATINSLPIACHSVLNGSSYSFVQDSDCLDDKTNADYNAVCEKFDSFFAFNLTILSPLHNNLAYEVSCFLPRNVFVTVAIQVQGTKCVTKC